MPNAVLWFFAISGLISWAGVLAVGGALLLFRAMDSIEPHPVPEPWAPREGEGPGEACESYGGTD